MAISVIGTPLVEFQGASTSSIFPASTINVATGDTIVVGYRGENTGINIASVTDTAGNEYTFAGYVNLIASASYFEVWYCTNAIAHATNLVTVNLTGAASSRGIGILQARGLATVDPIDVVVRIAVATATITSPAFTTKFANELIVAFAQLNATGNLWTAGSGYTGVQDSSDVTLVEYKIVSSIQTGVTADATNASAATKGMIVVTFHETISGGGSGEASAVL
jgi:hypothetical protein